MLREITNKEEFISLYPWIKECNFTEITPELVLARCIAGEYFGCVGEKDTVAGMAIYRPYGDMVFVVGAWAKNNLKEFMPEFLVKMKSLGFKTLRTSANFNETAYSRLTGLKKLWTVYEGAL